MSANFLCGMVEGFYGKPWTFGQRHKVVGWLSRFGLNTYVYGPKDDLKHRVLWRELLDESEAGEFERLIESCRGQGVRFVYAIAPGWDDLFNGNNRDATASGTLLDGLKIRFRQLLDLGCSDFAVMFDDIPNLPADELAEIGRRQATTGNKLHQWLANQADKEHTIALCPSVYCTRMAGTAPTDSSYLRALGETLDQAVDIFWTGPEIISPVITAEHLREVAVILRRPPLIWDNLHANDYDCARIFLGPYSDRSPDLPALARGLVINPNRQCELNFLPLATLGEFVRAGLEYSPDSATQKSIATWLPEWERVTGPAFTAQTVEFFVDCFHLPFAHGPKANALMSHVRAVLKNPPNEIAAPLQKLKETVDELGKTFFELSALKNRDLFEALWPHAWRLKDELGLVVAIGEQRINGAKPPFSAPGYPPGVFRGGLLGDLRELIQPVSGGFQTRL